MSLYEWNEIDFNNLILKKKQQPQNKVKAEVNTIGSDKIELIIFLKLKGKLYHALPSAVKPTPTNP